MPPRRRGSTTSASPVTPPSDLSASAGEGGPPSKAAAPVPEPRAGDPAGRPEEQTLTIRLPFLAVSLSRPVGPPAEPTPEASPRSKPTAKLPVLESGGGRRLLFYTGVAAMGVAGVVEWPVAVAIAAGTYIASKSRSTPTRPPSQSPGSTASV
jgi:hypothetical protein